MTTRPLFILVILISLASVFSSCETDVELNAPYKSTPVIVSVLEYTADTQFVRINRTFLGDQNATYYAQIRDSVEYDPSEVEAWLIKKINGNKLDSIQLGPIVKPSRDPGAFYDTDITFWYTSEDLFTEEEIDQIYSSTSIVYSYELNVDARDKNYVAETGFPRLKDGAISYPAPPNFINPQGSLLEFYNQNSNSYQTLSFRYSAKHPTARYQGVLRLNCNYEKTDGTVVENQFIDYQLGITEHQISDLDGTYTFTFNAENWYAYVGNIVKDIPNIETVQMANLEFRLTGANPDLNAYINVAQPISDFTPVLTLYTNFNNGAIGILGSKTVAVSAFQLLNPSVAQLNTGEYAYGVSYCTIPPWGGSSYNCQ